jgi:hypothetical protein
MLNVESRFPETAPKGNAIRLFIFKTVQSLSSIRNRIVAGSDSSLCGLPPVGRSPNSVVKEPEEAGLRPPYPEMARQAIVSPAQGAPYPSKRDRPARRVSPAAVRLGQPTP